MTTLQAWVTASLDITKDNIVILDGLKEEGNLDKLIIQAYVLKKNVDSFVDFLEKRGKFG